MRSLSGPRLSGWRLQKNARRSPLSGGKGGERDGRDKGQPKQKGRPRKGISSWWPQPRLLTPEQIWAGFLSPATEPVLMKTAINPTPSPSLPLPPTRTLPSSLSFLLFPHLLWGNSESGAVWGLGGMLTPWELISAVGVVSKNVYAMLPRDN